MLNAITVDVEDWFHVAVFRNVIDYEDWEKQESRILPNICRILELFDEYDVKLWNYVGVVRSDKRLQRAQRRIKLLLDEIQEYYWNFKITKDTLELRNIAITAQVIIQGARLRKESRGLHYNLDYPHKDDANWRRDTELQDVTPRLITLKYSKTLSHE